MVGDPGAADSQAARSGDRAGVARDAHRAALLRSAEARRFLRSTCSACSSSRRRRVGTNAVLKPFQKARLFVFLNPKADPQGAGYNLNQSKIAVGNGEWLGRGLYHGTQTQLNFVPEHSRDFIFTVLAEEWGFAGALAADGALRRAALRRHSHDARRPRPLRLSARGRVWSGCCSFTSWSTSA